MLVIIFHFHYQAISRYITYGSMYDLISADKIIIVTTVADGDRKTCVAQERECVCV